MIFSLYLSFSEKEEYLEDKNNDIGSKGVG
jgi:hypothetical protein